MLHDPTNAPQDCPKNILLIEQEATLRDLISISLKRFGCTVRHTDDRDEAAKLIEQEWPDLVLLDLLASNINGLQLIEESRKTRAGRQIAIIVISSLAFGEVVQRALKIGANDFIVKPFSTEVLAGKVFRWLGKGHRQ